MLGGVLTTVKQHVVYSIITIIVVIALIVTIYFIKSKGLHKNHKFNVFINLISAYGAIALAITLILTIIFHKQDVVHSNFTDYLVLLKDYEDTIEMFMGRPEMNYYYNELFGTPELNLNVKYKRNYILEYQMSISIFSRLAGFNEYITMNQHIDPENTQLFKERMNNIFTLHFKSKLFRKYYAFYKKVLASKLTIQYVKENFNV